MKNRPLISIIMPAYNAEKYIAAAIQSVLNQTYSNWELLIIDDASMDHTGIISQSFQDQDQRIKYFKNPVNTGAAVTRNHGVQKASGEWIAFLDSDDCWASNKLELQMEYANHKHAEFIFTGSAFMNESGKTLNHYLAVPETVTFKQLLKQNVISCSSVLIKKNLLLPYPMQERQMHEDFATWLQILRTNHICAYGINQPLLIYRISATSKSGNKWKAARMTYRVYRFIGFNALTAVYYWCWYVGKSLIKYRQIYSK